MNRSNIRFIVVPLLLILSAFTYSELKGPNWENGQSDPEYAYLLNSLNILKLTPPDMVEHPGTTLQTLGAGLLFLKSSVDGNSDSSLTIVDKVLKNPENFLRFLRGFLIFFNSALVFILGVFTFRLTANIGCSIALQTIPFLSTGVFSSFTRFTPEPLLFASSQCVVLLLVAYIFSKEFKKEKLILFIGLIVGVSIATKVTFVPLCTLFFLIPNNREKIKSGLIALAAFTIAILPILPNVRQMSAFWKNVAIHRGNYGSGETGMPALSTLAGNLRTLVTLDMVFLPVLLLSLVTYFMNRSAIEEADPKRKRAWSVVCVLSLSLFAQVLLTTKSPDPRYLIPSTSLTALLLFLNFYLWPARFKKLGGALWIALTLFLTLNSFRSAIGTVAGIWKNRDEFQAARNIIETKYPKCTVVDYYNSLSKEYALAFGNSWVSHRYGSALERAYPGQLFYNLWGKYFYTFSDAHVDLDALKKRECVLMRGNPFTESRVQYLPAFKIEPVFQGDIAALYLVDF